MKKYRVLVLMHESLVPPDTLEGVSDEEMLEWKTEFDVVQTLRYMGHDVLPLGVVDDLGKIRDAIQDFRPHVLFIVITDQKSYLGGK